jgi:hypothetical protein
LFIVSGLKFWFFVVGFGVYGLAGATNIHHYSFTTHRPLLEFGDALSLSK